MDHTCSLCGKEEDEVEHIFTGLYGAVCSECVDQCAAILAGQRLEAASLHEPKESLIILPAGR